MLWWWFPSHSFKKIIFVQFIGHCGNHLNIQPFVCFTRNHGSLHFLNDWPLLKCGVWFYGTHKNEFKIRVRAYKLSHLVTHLSLFSLSLTCTDRELYLYLSVMAAKNLARPPGVKAIRLLLRNIGGWWVASCLKFLAATSVPNRCVSLGLQQWRNLPTGWDLNFTSYKEMSEWRVHVEFVPQMWDFTWVQSEGILKETSG